MHFAEKNCSFHIYGHVLLVIIQKLLTLYKFRKVQQFFQNIPMGIMSGGLLKGSHYTPQAIHTIDALYSSKWLGEKKQIFYKYYVSKLWISVEKYPQSVPSWSQFLSEVFSIFCFVKSKVHA